MARPWTALNTKAISQAANLLGVCRATGLLLAPLEAEGA